jgi:hypothetical protein
MIKRSGRVRIGIILAWSMMAAAWAGCGSGDFVTPPPPELRDANSAGSRVPTSGPSTAVSDPFVTGGTVRSIELIAARGQDPDEAAIEATAARTQAGFDKARLRILPGDEAASTDPSPGRNKSQVDLIREAVARKPKPQALIVNPDDPASDELARAVQDALAAKVPVVVIGHPIAGVKEGPGGAPMILVRAPSFADSARALVTSSIRNARNARLNPDGGAILLITTTSDQYLPDRVAAVREALKASKIAVVDEVRIPKDIQAGTGILKKRLLADPKPTMVLAFDFNALSASNTLAGQIVEQRPFIQAGYTSDDSLAKMVAHGQFAAIAEFAPARLTRKAVSVAVAAAQGRTVKSPVDITIMVFESQRSAGLPTSQTRFRPDSIDKSEKSQ